MEKKLSPTEGTTDKSIKRLKVFEKTGQHLFYASPIKIEDNFKPNMEFLSSRVDKAVSLLKNNQGFIYVFSKEDFKPIIFLKI